MTWNDILGFLIVLFIFLLPLLSKLFLKKEQKKESHPRIEEVSEEEEDVDPFPLSPPVIPRMVKENHELHSRLEAKKKKKKHLKLGTDPLSRILKGRTPLQAMMLVSQILGEYKSQDEL